jgi:hypothetical protein
MSANLVSLGLLLSIVAAAGHAAPPVDFDTQVVPALTIAGCNAGACHGAALGQGGLALSLWGSDPDADYQAIVRQSEGRRVNLAAAERSLIWRKPAGLLDHGGGAPLADGSPAGPILLAWLRQGAPRTRSRRLVRFTLAPAEFTAAVGDEVGLRAIAEFDTGQIDDVAHWVVLNAADTAAVEVLPSARVRIRRRGQHVVLGRYLDRIVPVRISVPMLDTAVDLTNRPRASFIDEEVLASLATLRLPVAPAADDAAFIRRATLDLTGRLPAPEAARAFVNDDRPDKRQQLIDDLLTDPAFIDHWTLWTARLLRLDSRSMDAAGAAALQGWVRECLVNSVPWDRMARELLTASGDSHRWGPAAFQRATSNPRDQAEHISEAFLGLRLRCANCHNHPLDRWTQDDYHGLAAAFARIDRGRFVAWGDHGEVIHPRTTAAASPRIPGGPFIDTVGDPRPALADWMTAADNPFFARAMVNRLWAALLGRGLVEPIDDLRETNPATHPELLDRLAADFVAGGYDIRRTLRLIAGSQTYARQAAAPPGNEADDRFYSHALRRPMSAEILADAWTTVLGVADPDLPRGLSAVQLVDAAAEAPSLVLLGRCPRTEACTVRSPQADLSRALHLLNGPLLNARIASSEGRLSRVLAAGWTDAMMLDEFYWRALGHAPDAEERSRWLTAFGAAGSADERRALWEDWVWALLNSQAFVTR